MPNLHCTDGFSASTDPDLGLNSQVPLTPTPTAPASPSLESRDDADWRAVASPSNECSMRVWPDRVELDLPGGFCSTRHAMLLTIMGMASCAFVLTATIVVWMLHPENVGMELWMATLLPVVMLVMAVLIVRAHTAHSRRHRKRVVIEPSEFVIQSEFLGQKREERHPLTDESQVSVHRLTTLINLLTITTGEEQVVLTTALPHGDSTWLADQVNEFFQRCDALRDTDDMLTSRLE